MYQENKKQKILNAATKVFARKGYIRTTVNDIAGEAEIGIGPLYAELFPDDEDHRAVKEEILLSIFDQFWRQTNEQISELPGGEPADRLKQIFDVVKDSFFGEGKDIYLARVLNENLPLDPTDQSEKNKNLLVKLKAIQEEKQWFLEHLDSIIKAGQDSDVFVRSVPAPALKWALFGALQLLVTGLFYQKKTKEIGKIYTQEDVTKVVERLIGVFLMKHEDV
jgi:AcrR family transcriptional regulator